MRPFRAHGNGRCSRTRFAQTPSQRPYSHSRSLRSRRMLAVGIGHSLVLRPGGLSSHFCCGDRSSHACVADGRHPRKNIACHSLAAAVFVSAIARRSPHASCGDRSLLCLPTGRFLVACLLRGSGLPCLCFRRTEPTSQQRTLLRLPASGPRWSGPAPTAQINLVYVLCMVGFNAILLCRFSGLVPSPDSLPCKSICTLH